MIGPPPGHGSPEWLLQTGRARLAVANQFASDAPGSGSRDSPTTRRGDAGQSLTALKRIEVRASGPSDRCDPNFRCSL